MRTQTFWVRSFSNAESEMKSTGLIILALFVGMFSITGCSNSTALTDQERKSIAGAEPPKDVWDKVGEAKANQPDRSKDYGTIPGASTTAPATAQTPGPINSLGR
jgi:hypothetical protein